MFKKILSVVLLASALFAPSAVSAAIETANKNAQITAQVTSSTSVKKIHSLDANSQTISAVNASFGEVESVLAKHSNQLEPLSADAWLISLALFGFVMLSNRSGV
jgi:hypothetical protein